MNFFRALPKDKLQKVVLVGIVTLIALAAVGNFYIRAQISTMSRSKDKIAKLKYDIDEAEREANQEAQNQQIRGQVTAFVQSQSTTMVSGDPFGWVVRQITLFAENHPVRVLSMRPGTIAPSQMRSRYSIYTARVELEGGYDQIGEFVKDFENGFPTSQIRSLELAASGTGRADRRAVLELAFLVQPDSDPEMSESKPNAEKKQAS
jgi:hypothetical protein